MTDTTVPAISLWQPWASLWLAGRKIHETRHWAIKHRGLLLVHAAKRIEFDIDPELREIVEDEFGGHWAMDLPRGAIVGALHIVDCVSTNGLSVSDAEFACGNFGPDRFAWRAERPQVFSKPIPYRGLQSLFRVSRDLIADQLGGAA